MPIRLSPTPTTSRVLPVARVKLGVSGSGDIASDSEQGPEGVERVESPVEAECELVEVGLEVLVAHAVMNATQPRLQVGEDEMNDRQILLSDLGVASLGDGEVFVAALGEAGIAGPIVGDDRRTRSNGALDKAAERFRAAVWHDSESDTSGVATALPLIELGSRLALSHFNGAGDKKLVVNVPIRLSPTPTICMAWRRVAREGDKAGMDVSQREDLSFPRSLPEFQRLFPGWHGLCRLNCWRCHRSHLRPALLGRLGAP